MDVKFDWPYICMRSARVAFSFVAMLSKCTDAASNTNIHGVISLLPCSACAKEQGCVDNLMQHRRQRVGSLEKSLNFCCIEIPENECGVLNVCV